MNKVTVNGRQLGLAFWEKADEVEALARAGCGIVVMPTGTGKTTQTPQLLHEQGFTRKGQVYVSVPRRVLAVELASRVSEEMQVSLGGLVGYQIRGEQRMSRETRILFMTEGMLRAKIRSNPMLEGISCVLFDEFHMRTLMSDFNVALVERAQLEGSKAAFLLMSATVDPSYLAQHFSCGVVDGSDLVTTFPIEERYVEPSRYDYFGSVAQEAANVSAGREGNGLIFMPGKAEIEKTVSALRRALPKDGYTVLPLHGELGPSDRHAPFVERGGVTITVATDIVETGATLPNISWVIDSGEAREKGYDPVSDISSLALRDVAQDRLKQRRGRCGRVRSGVCVGMFSRENMQKRPERTVPEIFRTPLREVVLTIKALGLSRIGKPIRLVDNPPKANWKEAKRQLQMLGFADTTEAANITPLGEKAVELGCDPREAAMLFKAAELGCLRETAIAIAVTQAKRLLYRPKDEEEALTADRAHSVFKSVSTTCDASVFVAVVNAAEKRGEESLGSWCKRNYVSYLSLHEIWDSSRQLLSAMRAFGFKPNDTTASEDALRQSILAGLPDRIFKWSHRGWFRRESDGKEVMRGDESVVRVPQRDEVAIAAWNIIEITTRRGVLPLATNAVLVG
ncbi:MAG: hypothetical protein COV91_02605 [Candidatus Taylorbacteria bacterium CG11_big_fil_rev_8_21_14_0_20_46_11]|uniref:Helicase n=1 Tax=Candidatus Taylorbacteria bacterium CG11_big_fil_rev_8_21_14_0_20_46_11 TaxID=1975025 RepID=A0A2H0KBW4_9BACT|nr:MAG: hypothetical protein COV91_02605 [Candidatus Taylorbacteria bacterium CG11_big_fil_rev_8_21_14_0_20_46_11]